MLLYGAEPPADAGGMLCNPQPSETHMRRTARKGFTLIELLIVVVIIGILAAIAIPKFANTKEKAYIAAMKSDLRNLVTAEEAFFADSVKYTATMSQLNYRPSTGVWTPSVVVGAGFWTAGTTHTQVTGKSCQIAVNTSNTLVPAAGDGEPACK
jgi:type IV pilus assembly protein PilA